MRIPRIFIAETLNADTAVALPEAAANHVTRVLRLSEGAPLVCFNGDGQDWPARLERVGKHGVVARLDEPRPAAAESPLAITLAQSIARGEKMDLILQKATELGVAEIAPLVSERTEVRLDEDRAERRVEHWQRVVISACEQSGRAVVPIVETPLGIAALAERLRDDPRLKLALHPDPKARGVAELEIPSEGVILAIGPEGGFSDRDLDALAQAGFTRLRLGPRVLRTETAGLAALAALQSRFGDLN
jgi:16S rRNA (uracil1498-N3)-methyltransferase